MIRIQPQSVTFKGSSTPPVVTPQGPRAPKFLSYVGKNGNGVGLVTMSTSLAVGLLRPLVIMFDKNASKEEKIHAASWIFALSMAGFAMQAALLKPFNKLANVFAKDVLKLSAPKAIEGAASWANFFLFNAAAVVATYLNTRYVGRVMDAISQKFFGKKFSKEPKKPLTEEQKKKEKRIDKMILGGAIALGSFIGLNIIGRKLTGRPIASDALAKGYKNTVNFLSKNSGLFRKFQGFIKAKGDGLAKWANRSGKGIGTSSWFAKEASVGDGWIVRNMIANTIVRPTIALLSGQPYVAFRCIVDEGLGALIVKFAGDPIIRQSKPLFNKAFRVTPESLKALTPEAAKYAKEGINVITGQAIRNIALLCIALGFMNNFLSARMVKFLDKFKKDGGGKEAEQGYKDFRQQFIPAISMSQERAQVYAATNPQEWLNALQKTPASESFQHHQAVNDYLQSQTQTKQA